MKSWITQADLILDEVEASTSQLLPSLVVISKQLGINRVTLWRSSDFMARYNRISEAKRINHGSSCSGGRKSTRQEVLSLRNENLKLRIENDRLLQNFIVVSRRLNEHGIDPFKIFGKFNPTPNTNIWESEILPWEES